jgi:hypothetical protein
MPPADQIPVVFERRDNYYVYLKPSDVDRDSSAADGGADFSADDLQQRPATPDRGGACVMRRRTPTDSQRVSSTAAVR